MKKFKTFLTEMALHEMPLPKGMNPEDLEPEKKRIRKTDYNPTKAMSNLQKAGQHLASGSSRAAYRIHVEKEQFDYDTSHLPQTNDGRVDTVIKIAMNSKGIAQNKEEVDVYKRFKHNKLLLPIIDDSYSNKKKIMIEKGKDAPLESIPNWLQMPYVHQLEYSEMETLLVSYFGNVYGAIYGGTRSSVFRVMGNNNIEKFKDLEPSEDINKEQLKNLQDLVELAEGGLDIADLAGPMNWGVYNGNPVILDYGFGTSTTPLYYTSKIAEAKVDPKGNIILNIKDED